MKTRFGSEKQKKQEKKNSSVNLTKKPLLKQSKLDFSCTSQDAEQSIMIKESRRNISNNSFKDGMCVPSYEDISSEKKICNNNTDIETRYGSRKNKERKKHYKELSYVNVSKTPKLRQCKLDFSCTSQDVEQSIKNKESQRNISNNSFKRYGRCVPSYEDISREKKIYDNNTDVETRYGSRNNKKQKKLYKNLSSMNTKKKPVPKKCKLNFGCTSQDAEQPIKNKEKQRNISDVKPYNSFKKYGMYVPSYEDILNEKKNCDIFNEIVMDMMESISPLPVIKKSV